MLTSFRTRLRARTIPAVAAVAITALCVAGCSSGSSASGSSGSRSSGSASAASGAASSTAGASSGAGSSSAAAGGSSAASGASGGSASANAPSASVPVQTPTKQPPFVLGVGLPLTGTNAQYGIGSQVAYQAAAGYINQHGGMDGHPLQLSFWDTAGQPATGVAGTQKFITSKVNAVAGYFNSDVTIPSVKLLAKAGIPLFADNPSTPALATMGLTNFTRVTGNDKNEGLVQADFVYNQLHKTTAVVIDDNESFGQAFAQAFADEYTKLGGKILKRYSIDSTVTDYTSVLSQIKTLKPEVLDYSGFDPAAAQLASQAKTAGLDAVYVTDSSQYGADFVKLAGKAAAGVYMTNSIMPTSTGTELYKVLSSALGAKKIDVTPIFATAFDTALDAWHASNLAKSIDSAALLKVMHQVTFQGVTGKVSFIPDGDRAEVSYGVLQIQPDGSYKTVFTYKKTLN